MKTSEESSSQSRIKFTPSTERDAQPTKGEKMKYLLTLIILLASLYISVAGYEGAKTLQGDSIKETTTGKKFEYNGIIFDGERNLIDFIHESQSDRWFGWIFSLPTTVVLLVGAMAAGVFGGAARIMMRLPKDSKAVRYSEVFGDPVVGLCMGFLLFFFSLAVPAVFSKGSNPVRPETVLVFSMFGGLFSEKAYKWLEGQVTRLFS
jgi:hypothetical protein